MSRRRFLPRFLASWAPGILVLGWTALAPALPARVGLGAQDAPGARGRSTDSVPPEGRAPVTGRLDAVDAREPESERDGTDGANPPVPVLLVPGWSDGPEELEPLEVRLLESGWPLGRVLAVEFEDPVGSNRTHAGTVADAVRSLRASTGAPRVDIVAHSMGGLAVRRYLRDAVAGRDSAGVTLSDAGTLVQRDPETEARSEGSRASPADSISGEVPVRRVVFLGTPHAGTAAAWLAWGEGGDEMQPGSPFLDSLNAAPFVPESVEALAVRTPLDLRVIPGESASLPEADNTRNVEICCPTHPGLVDHDETFQAVVEFLRERDGEDGGDEGEPEPETSPQLPGRSPRR